jgi:hypothetical protein
MAGTDLFLVAGEIDIMEARGNGPRYAKQFVAPHSTSFTMC